MENQIYCIRLLHLVLSGIKIKGKSEVMYNAALDGKFFQVKKKKKLLKYKNQMLYGL